MKYHAFISYSHRDRKWGDWLHRALETYRVPQALIQRSSEGGRALPERIFPVFRDREELPTATNLGEVIQRALEESRFLIVICSPNSACSQWVNEEIRKFKQLQRQDCILALIVDGEPNAADGKAGFSAADECFPPALRFADDGDSSSGRAKVEPIAADLRPDCDGKRDGLLKIVAGLLGVGFDDLKRRDEIRRRRRARAWLGAAVGLAALMAALAAFSLWQWREAELQRAEALRSEQRAVASEGEAVHARDEARRTLARSLHQQGVATWADGYHAKAVAHLTAAYRQEASDPVYRSTVGSVLLAPPRFLVARDPVRLGGQPWRMAGVGEMGQMLIATVGGGVWQVDVKEGEVIHHRMDDGGGLLNISVTPDGKTRAVATMKGIGVWRESLLDQGPDYAVDAQGAILGPDLVLSATGDHLLARSFLHTLLFAAEANTVTHLNLATGEAFPLSLQSPAVIRHSLAVSGGDEVYFLHEDGLLFSWHPVTGWNRPFGEGVHIEHFDVNPDGEKIALSSVEGVWVIDRDNGERQVTIRQPDWAAEAGNALGFSPAGEYLTVVWQGSGGYWLGVYDAASGVLVSPRLLNLGWQPGMLHFDDVGERILACGPSGELVVLAVADWGELLRVKHGEDRVFGGFLPEGVIWSYGDDGWLRYWQAGEARVGPQRIPVGLSIDDIVIRAGDGLALLVLEGGRWHQLWSLRHNTPLHPPVFHGGQKINCALLPADGEGAILLIGNARLERWDGGGEQQAVFPEDWAESSGLGIEGEDGIQFQFWKAIGEVPISPQGFVVVTEAVLDLERAQKVMGPIEEWTPDSPWDELRRSDAYRGRLIFLDAETLREVERMELDFSPMWPVFSADGTTLAMENSAGRPGVGWFHNDEADRWQPQNNPWSAGSSEPGEPVETFLGRGISRDGGVLYRRGAGRTIEIHRRPAAGLAAAPLTIVADRTVVETELSPCGEWLAVALDSGSDRHQVQVYETRGGTPAGPELEHDGAIIDMQFADDEHCLFTVARDRTIRRWHFPSGRLSAVPLRHSQRLNGLMWMDAWRELIAYSADGNLVRYPFPDADDFSPSVIDAVEALWETRLDGLLRNERLHPGRKWELLKSDRWHDDAGSWWLAAFAAALGNEPAPGMSRLSSAPSPDEAVVVPAVVKGDVSFGGRGWALSGNGKMVMTLYPDHMDVVLYDFNLRSSGDAQFELHKVVASLIEYNESGRFNFVDDASAEWVLERPRLVGHSYDPGVRLLRLPVGANALKGREIRLFFYSGEGFVPARVIADYGLE